MKRPRNENPARRSPQRRASFRRGLLLRASWLLLLLCAASSVGLVDAKDHCCTLCLWCQEGEGEGDDPNHPSANPGDAQELLTTFEGGNGQSGIMFDVQNTHRTLAARIRNLVLHTSATREVTVQVLAKTGTYEGYERNPSKWEHVAEVRDLIGRGEGQRTPLPEGSLGRRGLTIPPGHSAALYVTLTEYVRREVSLIYTDGRKVGRTVAESEWEEGKDGGLKVMEGAAVAYPFGEWWAPRVFNGAIVYEMLDLTNDGDDDDDGDRHDKTDDVFDNDGDKDDEGGDKDEVEATTTAATAAAAKTTTTAATTMVHSNEEPDDEGSDNGKVSFPSTSTTTSKPEPVDTTVAADLVLELSPLSRIMDSDALLVFQAACQSFLGELFRYTLPPVGDVECRIRGQAVVGGRQRRRLLPSPGSRPTSASSTRDAAAPSGGKRALQTGDDDGDGDDSVIDWALQIHLKISGALDSAPVNNRLSSHPNPHLSDEQIDFRDTAVDFFSVVGGQFLSVLEEVAEGTGVGYFAGVENVRVVENLGSSSDGGGSGGGGSRKGGEDKSNDSDDEDGKGGTTAIMADNGGNGIGRGLTIFLVVMSVNVVGLVIACLYVRSRRKNPEWSHADADRPEVKSTPPGSVFRPGDEKHNRHRRNAPSTPPSTPQDRLREEDGKALTNAGAGAAAALSPGDDDSLLRPPCSVVPGAPEDDVTFTSRLQDFDSVAGGAARERRREALAAEAWRRMAGIGIANAVAVDAFVADGGGDEYNGGGNSSLMGSKEAAAEAGAARAREEGLAEMAAMATATATAAAGAAVAVDAFVESETGGVRYRGSTLDGQECGSNGGSLSDGRFNVSTVAGMSQEDTDNESGPGTDAGVRLEGQRVPPAMLLESSPGPLDSPSMPTLVSGAPPSLATIGSPPGGSGIIPYVCSSPVGRTIRTPRSAQRAPCAPSPVTPSVDGSGSGSGDGGKGRGGDLAGGPSIPALADVAEDSAVTPPPPLTPSSVSPPLTPSTPAPGDGSVDGDDGAVGTPSVCGASTAVPSLARTPGTPSAPSTVMTYGDIASPVVSPPSVVAGMSIATPVVPVPPPAPSPPAETAAKSGRFSPASFSPKRGKSKSPGRSKSPSSVSLRKVVVGAGGWGRPSSSGGDGASSSPAAAAAAPPGAAADPRRRRDNGNYDEGRSAVTTASDWFQRMISDAVGGASVVVDEGTAGAGDSSPRETAVDRRRNRMRAAGNGLNAKRAAAGLFRFGKGDGTGTGAGTRRQADRKSAAALPFS